MINSPEQAAKAVLNGLKGYIVPCVKENKDSYLVYAVSAENPYNDYSNTIFLVNKANGKTLHFNPNADIELFSKINQAENLLDSPVR